MEARQVKQLPSPVDWLGVGVELEGDVFDHRAGDGDVAGPHGFFYLAFGGELTCA